MWTLVRVALMTSKKAIYPGTFDPITIGHFDIVKRAANIFDHVIIGVAAESTKKTLFSVQERAEIIAEELKNSALQNVSVKLFGGLLIDFAAQESAFTIVRGLRAASDFEYEFQLSYINHKMNNKIETVLLPATENSHYISSTFVKEIVRLGGDISKFVSTDVEERLKKKFKINS